jgi:pimeloyl-ACP methyl ester carboxylesterase
MNKLPGCEHECPLAAVCTERGECQPANGLVSLHEALCHFEREAVHGVCDTGRHRCAYYSWGEGPPLVFVHGLGDNNRSFVQPIFLLKHRFRCIAYNLPAGQRGTHAGLVADLFALLDHLGLKRSYLYGSSFGSTVVLAALREAPQRLPRAILQGGFAHRPLTRAEVWLARLGCLLPGRLHHLPLWSHALRRLHHEPFTPRSPEVWQYFQEQVGQTAIHCLARRALLLHALDLRSILSDISQPVLLICGEGDRRVGRDCEVELLRGLPNVRRAELGGCGHLPYHTHPEVLADLIGEFLTPPVSAAAPAPRCGTAG